MRRPALWSSDPGDNAEKAARPGLPVAADDDEGTASGEGTGRLVATEWETAGLALAFNA